MNPEQTLRLVHALQLKITLEIRRICEAHHIPFFLTAGSTLGAVRHKGFIPWDEDMDIGMLRQDYDRFLQVCQTELGEEYFLQTWDTEPDYPMSLAKIRLNDTLFVEAFSRDTSFHHGIFVDIFPYDSVPESPFLRHVQSIGYYLLNRMLWIKKGCGTNMKDTRSQAIRYYFFRLFSLPFPYSAVKALFNRMQTLYNGQNTPYIVTVGSYSYRKEMILRDWATDLAPVLFENVSLPTYRNWDAYLRHMYGDYMKLPPMEKRHKHDIISVNLGAYQSMPQPEKETTHEIDYQQKNCSCIGTGSALFEPTVSPEQGECVSILG